MAASAAVRNVFGDRAGEDEGVLAHVADQLANDLPRDAGETRRPPGSPRLRRRAPVASACEAMSSCRSPDRPATPIVSPCRIELDRPLRAGLTVLSAPRYADAQIPVTNRGSPTTSRGSRSASAANEASMGSTEKPEQIADPQAALVGLVDEAMDLVQGRHHVEVQVRKM